MERRTIDLYERRLIDVVPIPWKLQSVRPDDRTIDLRYSTGDPDCYHLARAEIEYRTETVTVTLFEGYIPPVRFCTAIGLIRLKRLTLHEPLEGRQLIDGSPRADRATPTGAPTP